MFVKGNMINHRKEFKKAQQLAKRKADLSGNGSYLFENNTKGDFYLPRLTKDGLKVLKAGGQFVGDDYYFGLLKTGELKLVKELNEAPGPEKLFLYKNFNRDETRLHEPNRDGQYIIPPTGEFVGDSRFFPLLKTGRLKLIKEVESQMTTPEKLITEQPPVITHMGQVEFVKNPDGEYLTEEQRKKKQQKLNALNPQLDFISENPMDGVKLLLD